MAAKKSKKASKTLGKKSMKKTKGGAVDMFLKQKTTNSLSNVANTSLNSSLNSDLGGLNFHK